MSAPTIAYFVTPHGFGHAARSAAVIEALGRRERDLTFEILTTVPEWFFAQSLTVRHRVRQVVSDVGLMQADPMREDLEATQAALRSFWSGLGETADQVIDNWHGEVPRFVVSDISPLGLEIASRLGVPSVLVESFTWDWIYAAYLETAPGLLEFAERSAELTATATLRIQCEPLCRRETGTEKVGVVSRKPRGGTVETRRALGLEAADSRPLVLLTMGGMGWQRQMSVYSQDYFLVTLGGVDKLSREPGLLRLPNQSPVHPPDLVAAADAVVAKLGYSTVAECFRAGTRMGYMTRSNFPESPVLERFVKDHLPSIEFDRSLSEPQAQLDRIERLLALPAGKPRDANGAEEIASLLLSS